MQEIIMMDILQIKVLQFNLSNQRLQCTIENCTENYAATTNTTSLMYHLRNSHNIELIDNSKPDDDQSDDSLDTSNHKTRMPTNKTKYRQAETDQ